MRKCIYVVLFFLNIISLQANTVIPTLDEDCDFSVFQKDRMPKERELFWTRTEDIETHDLKGEREYNKTLTEQIVSCYNEYKRKDLRGCNFKRFEFDDKKIQTLSSQLEYSLWQINQSDGATIVYPAKVEYLKSLADRLLKCFSDENKEKFTNVTKEKYFMVFSTIKSLQGFKLNESDYLTLIPSNAILHFGGGWGRDHDDEVYHIHLNNKCWEWNKDQDATFFGSHRH